MLLPFIETEAQSADMENWFNFFLNTFVVLSPNTQTASVKNSMQRYYEKDAAATFDALKVQYGLGADSKLGT